MLDWKEKGDTFELSTTMPCVVRISLSFLHVTPAYAIGYYQPATQEWRDASGTLLTNVVAYLPLELEELEE